MRQPPLLFTTSLLALGTLATLGACTDAPPSPATVRSHIASDLAHVLTEAAAASDAASSMIPSGTLSIVERALGVTSDATIGNFVARADRAMGAPFDGDAIIEELNTKIFTESNEVEDGVFTVPASLACETTDLDCAASWAKLALRIRVAEAGRGLRFAVQIGAAHDEPLEVSLAPDSLALSLDLDEAEAATIAIATAFGETAPNADLSGKLTATLKILGAAHASVSFDIDRAIDIAVADAGAPLAGPDAVRVKSAAAHVLAMEIDGTAHTGAFALGLGATTFHAPGTDSFDLDLPGATAAVELAAGLPILVKNLSLGNRTTKLSRNGAVAVAIDLNANGGRALDAAISFDETTGAETFAVTPHLDIEVATNHAVLGDTPGVYDVTRVRLDGNLRTSEGSDQIAVSGSFAITTNPAQYGVTATTGQCVSSTEQLDPTTDEPYTAWTAGACH